LVASAFPAYYLLTGRGGTLHDVPQPVLCTAAAQALEPSRFDDANIRSTIQTLSSDAFGGAGPLLRQMDPERILAARSA
jgi:hypothetical protein